MVITDIVQEKTMDYVSPPGYDGLWKKIIGDLFEEFMLFFAPNLHAEIDFTKEYDFLEQELYQYDITLKCFFLCAVFSSNFTSYRMVNRNHFNPSITHV